MKSKIALLATLALSATAYASALNYAGKFSEVHDIMIVGYENEADCTSDNGKWEQDMCLFETSDDVEVNEAVDVLTVEIVGTNAHTCSYEGPIVSKTLNTLVSQVESDEWNETTGDFEKATCEVTATYSDNGNAVAIDNNGKCRSFCGARAHLQIGKALRRL